MQKAELLNVLKTYFNDSELRELCLELNIDYEILAGTGKGDKARELIMYLERREKLSDLLKLCQKLRPNVSWFPAEPIGKAKTKILFLGSNPSSMSHLKLDEEIKKIQSNLRSAKERDNLQLKQEWAITIDTLIQAILDESPTIVHFSGHGQEDGIIVQNEIGEPKILTAEALSSLFKLFKDTLKCVVLNACYSEHQAKAIKLHVPYVIGMRLGILDQTAILFSTGFYKAIGAGKDIPFAFELGITAIKLEGVSGDNIPVLL